MRKFKSWYSGLSKGGKFFFVVAVIGVVWVFGAIANAGSDNSPIPQEQNVSQEITAEADPDAEPVVEIKTITEKVEIDFAHKTVEDPDLEKGEERIVTAGVKGEKHLIYEQKIVDGVAGKKKLIKQKIVVKPTHQIMAIGTKVVIAQPSCNSNYSGGCVPIASDVDCSSGSGNGPAYISGPVYVVGYDVYDLDRDGNGVACE